jgi:hypothetical protein
MHPKIKILTEVVEGEVTRNKRAIKEAFNSFGGKLFTVTFEIHRSKRSLSQNAYLHVLFSIFSKELIALTGDKMYTPTLMKDLCKGKFLKRDVVNPETGEILGEIIRETSSLNKSEMADFIDDIHRWSVQTFNIVLPLPGEQMEIIMGE